MKKFLCILLAVCIALSVCACGWRKTVAEAPRATPEPELTTSVSVYMLNPGIGSTPAETFIYLNYENGSKSPDSAVWRTEDGHVLDPGEAFEASQAYSVSISGPIGPAYKKDNVEVSNVGAGTLTGWDVDGKGSITIELSVATEEVYPALRLDFPTPAIGSAIADYPNDQITVTLDGKACEVTSAGLYHSQGNKSDTIDRGGWYQVSAKFIPCDKELLESTEFTVVTNCGYGGRALCEYSESSPEWYIYVDFMIPLSDNPDEVIYNITGSLPCSAYRFDTVSFEASENGVPVTVFYSEVATPTLEEAGGHADYTQPYFFSSMTYTVDVCFDGNRDGFKEENAVVGVPAGFTFEGISAAEDGLHVLMSFSPKPTEVLVTLNPPAGIPGSPVADVPIDVTVNGETVQVMRTVWGEKETGDIGFDTAEYFCPGYTYSVVLDITYAKGTFSIPEGHYVMSDCFEEITNFGDVISSNIGTAKMEVQKGMREILVTFDVPKDAEIPEHEHIPVLAEYVDATCTENGHSITVCKICGEQLSYSVIPAGHHYVWDCGTSYHRHVCTRCGASTPYESHTYVILEETDSYEYWMCPVCNYYHKQGFVN